MKNLKIVSIVSLTLFSSITLFAETVTISKDTLRDKIKGGWAGQTIGCTFGGPTEFKFRSAFIPDYMPIEWNEGLMKWSYENSPGLYDDIYMDLTFVEVFEKQGLDAPAEAFAKAFANAEYQLWHANQAARYNILRGVMPPKSGHWLYNPHAEDIDFQIEADFAGLMSPGMVNTSSEICDRIGHIMNYGDGWYGGVYVAAMYALAFVSDDIDYVVNEALRAIPKESQFRQCMVDTIRWSGENPENWKVTWFKVQEKWGEDVGCPDGVFTTFNIDAKINSAWIILGLLYGDGDYGKTLSISTRAGDDSDCNPASAGGILGAMLGYKKIPDYWKQGLSDVEPIDFKYTTISLNDTYDMSFRHALKVIEGNGGRVDGDSVEIEVQKPKAVPLEVGFKGHYPAQRKRLGKRLTDEASFEFEGVGFSLTGGARKGDAADGFEFEVEMYIDRKLVETTKLPTRSVTRKTPVFWQYQLPQGKHVVRLKVLNPAAGATIELSDLIVYTDRPVKPTH